MAIFDRKSRYAGLTPEVVTDEHGRTVLALPIVDAPVQGTAGIHRRTQGERLDHIAAARLRDANATWRLAEANDAMAPEVLAERDEIVIPTP
jgi:hypothetical protein